jgi:glutamyl-tRNA synthetase
MLAQAEPFSSQLLEQLTHDFVEANGIKIWDVVHAVRVAVTGKAVGFGLFETLSILGRERCLARIDRAIQRAEDPPQSVS